VDAPPSIGSVLLLSHFSLAQSNRPYAEKQWLLAGLRRGRSSTEEKKRIDYRPIERGLVAVFALSFASLECEERKVETEKEREREREKEREDS